MATAGVSLDSLRVRVSSRVPDRRCVWFAYLAWVHDMEHAARLEDENPVQAFDAMRHPCRAASYLCMGCRAGNVLARDIGILDGTHEHHIALPTRQGFDLIEVIALGHRCRRGVVLRRG